MKVTSHGNKTQVDPLDPLSALEMTEVEQPIVARLNATLRERGDADPQNVESVLSEFMNVEDSAILAAGLVPVVSYMGKHEIPEKFRKPLADIIKGQGEAALGLIVQGLSTENIPDSSAKILGKALMNPELGVARYDFIDLINSIAVGGKGVAQLYAIGAMASMPGSG